MSELALTTAEMLEEVSLNDGGTFMPNYNGTLWTTTSDITTGFWVSESGLEIKTPDLSFINLSEYAQTLMQLAPLAYVGFWLDGDYWAIDASHHFETIDAAMSFARENSQLAIFDIQNGEAIDTF